MKRIAPSYPVKLRMEAKQLTCEHKTSVELQMKQLIASIDLANKQLS